MSSRVVSLRGKGGRDLGPRWFVAPMGSRMLSDRDGTGGTPDSPPPLSAECRLRERTQSAIVQLLTSRTPCWGFGAPEVSWTPGVFEDSPDVAWG